MQAAIRPPTFVFFVNDAKLFTETYRRYMEKQLRAGAGFSGTPIRLLWRSRRKLERDGGKLKLLFLLIYLCFFSVYFSFTCSCENNDPSSDNQALFAFSLRRYHYWQSRPWSHMFLCHITLNTIHVTQTELYVMGPWLNFCIVFTGERTII